MKHDLSRSRAAFLLAVLAVAIFGLHLSRLSDEPQYLVLRDALHYAQQARDIAEGGFPRYNRDWAPLPPPLYPVALAPARRFAGAEDFPWWSRVVNLMLMVSILVPAYRLARVGLPRRWSVLAAVIALAAPFTFYTRLLLSENLAIPMFLWLSVAVVCLTRRPGPGRALTAGLVLGLCVLAKTLFVVTAPAVILAVAWGRRSIRAGVATAFWTGLAAALVVAAWKFRGFVFPSEAGLEPAFSYGAEFTAAGLQSIATYLYWIRSIAFCWVVGPGPIMLTLGLCCILAWFVRHDPARRGYAAWLLFAGGSVTGFTSIFLAQVALWKPIVHERYLVFLWPLVTIAFVNTLHSVRGRKRGLILAALAIVAVMVVCAPAKPLDPRTGNVFEFPSLAQFYPVIGANGETLTLRLILLGSLVLIPLFYRGRNWAVTGLLLLGLAFPVHGAYVIFKIHSRFDSAKAADVAPAIRWLRAQVEPEDVIVHHTDLDKLAYHVATHLEKRYWEVGEDLKPVWWSPVRYEPDQGRLACPEPPPGGRALLLTRADKLPHATVIAGFRDLRLIRFEGGRYETLADPALRDGKPVLDGVYPDYWCAPRARVRQRLDGPGTYHVSLVVSLPENVPLDGPQALRFRGSIGESDWEPLARGQRRTLKWVCRIDDPDFTLEVEARRSFERDGRTLAVFVDGFALERVKVEPSTPTR